MQTDQPKKRVFKKQKYRGVELDKLLKLSREDLSKMQRARARRQYKNGYQEAKVKFINKLVKRKQATAVGDKPKPVNTRIRTVIVEPAMIGCVAGIYNGRDYVQVEIKHEMVGHIVGEFALTYKPTRHGKPGIGATNSSKSIK